MILIYNLQIYFNLQIYRFTDVQIYLSIYLIYNFGIFSPPLRGEDGRGLEP